MEVKLKNALLNKSYIFLAEAKAIDLALDLVEHSDSTRFITFSDSCLYRDRFHSEFPFMQSKTWRYL